MNKERVFLNHLGMICSAGESGEAIFQATATGQKETLVSTDRFSEGVPFFVGEVKADLELPPCEPIYQTRNNAMLWSAMKQIQAGYLNLSEGISPYRIGVVIGTSTSGVSEADPAFSEYEKTGHLSDDYHYRMQEMSSPAEFLAHELGIKGPVYSLSTACSSGAKALAAGRRLIRSGVCDLVLAGGVDTLCKLTVRGFASLEAMSHQIANPFSVNRDGINIGEGAALFTLSKQPAEVALLGVGETSDAHHFSAPHPEGRGAEQAMRLALQDADVASSQIGYINLHGTGTHHNDAMESKAVETVLGSEMVCSSTKPFTGHTLGAAGAIEAGICWHSLQDDAGRLPVHIWDGKSDLDSGQIHLSSLQDQLQPSTCVMSNSFAFGGNNISLILGK